MMWGLGGEEVGVGGGAHNIPTPHLICHTTPLNHDTTSHLGIPHHHSVAHNITSHARSAFPPPLSIHMHAAPTHLP